MSTGGVESGICRCTKVMNLRVWDGGIGKVGSLGLWIWHCVECRGYSLYIPIL